MKFLQALLGILIFITSIAWGWSFNRYESFITMVIGYWLFFDSLNKIFFKESLITKSKPSLLIKTVFLGALLGIVLDFDMTLAHIIEYYTMNNIWNLFLLYLGWGIGLLAIYESYVFFLRNFLRLGKIKFQLFPNWLNKLLLKYSGFIGCLLILFVFLFFIHSSVPGWFVMFLFLGNWLILEFLQYEQTKSGLLKTLLEGNWNHAIAIWPAAIFLCIAWEYMNLRMGHWAYVNIFWLEPKILGIPLTAFFGYFCWFVIYLAFYKVFVNENDKLWEL